MGYNFLTKAELADLLCKKLAEHNFKTTKSSIGSRCYFRGKPGSRRLYGVYLTAREGSKGSIERVVERLEREGVEFSQKPGDPPKKREPKKRPKKPAHKLELREGKDCPYCAFSSPWHKDEEPLFCPNCQEPWV